MARPPFPHVVDATMLGAFRSCPRKMQLAYVEHWKPKAESVHLVAGGAFATGIEIARRRFYEDGWSPDDAQAAGLQALLKAYGAFECPEDSAKSASRMAGALEFYFDRYPLATDDAQVAIVGGRRAIEFSFAEPLDVIHPVTGDPILYCGRSDALMDFAGGLWVTDEKTTGSLGSRWVQQWDLRSQFTGYCWAALRAGLRPAGVLVRGIAIRKEGYDTAQALTSRAQWEIDRWHVQTLRDLERMIAHWEAGYWDYNLDHACTEYGGCGFRQICRSPQPEAWLPLDFERRRWDPLTRTETLLTADHWEEPA